MDDRPRLSGRRVAGLTGALTATLMGVRLAWIEPWLRVPGRRIHGRPLETFSPEGLAALPFAGLFALGLAVLVGLAVANRHRWRAVLRPNRGRLIGAFVLGFFTPIAVYLWWPFVIGMMWLTMAVPAVFAMPHFVLLGLAIIAAAAALWYPAACLIVSGIHNRWARVAVFALMFWSAYSAFILLQGAGPRFTL